MERHGCNGKTEMWYVVDAKYDAKLLSGFASPVTEEEYNSVDVDSYNNSNNSRGLTTETIETTYKKLHTTMYTHYTLYRYKATLDWKLRINTIRI